MKISITISFLLILFLSMHTAFGQCPPGDVGLSTQYQADYFAKKYPDCTEIDGNLTLSGTFISDWAEFPNITRVKGDLSLSGFRDAESLEGLIHSIVRVDSNVSIRIDFDELEQGAFLADQQIVDGDLRLEGFDISSWDFSHIDTISGRLALTSLSNVDDLELFEHLRYVGGLTIENNPKLTNIRALENLKNFPDGIVIHTNPKLVDCDIDYICQGIENYAYLYVANNALGNCRNTNAVYKNCGLESEICEKRLIRLETQEEVDAFNQEYGACMDTINSLTIHGEDIVHLDSLYSISVVKNLWIKAGSLKNLEGLENVKSINKLTIRDCYELESLADLRFEDFSLRDLCLENLPGVDGQPIGCDSIHNELKLVRVSQAIVDKFADVSYIASFSINQSDCTDIDDFLHGCAIPGGGRISSCDALKNVVVDVAGDGFGSMGFSNNASLESVSSTMEYDTVGALSFGSCHALKDIHFPRINSLRSISVTFTDDLEQINIDSLASLKVIIIRDNEALADISFLEHVDTQLEIVSLHHNPMLDNCKYEVLCHFIDNVQNADYAWIVANGERCNWTSLECVNSGNIYTPVTISSQMDMDYLVEMYPHADSIFGVVDISDFDGDLSYFEQIKYVDTTFSISNSSASLEPLRHCVFKDFNLSYYEGEDLPIFEGMDSIRRLEIKGCFGLTDMQAFSMIQDISVGLILDNLPNLTSLDELHDGLQVKTLNLRNLIIDRLDKFESIEELRGLWIQGLDHLKDLKDLAKLTKIDHLVVKYCDSLTGVFVPNQIQYVDNVELSHNEGLIAIHGFEDVVDILRLRILDNHELERIDNFPSLTNENVVPSNFSSSSFDISSNDSLLVISLPVLEELQWLNIEHNSILNALDIGDELSIGRRLQIVNNDSLDVCNFEWMCRAIEEAPHFKVSGNGPNCSDQYRLYETCGLEVPRCPELEYFLASKEDVEIFNTYHSTCPSIFGGLTISLDLDSTEVKPILDSLRVLGQLRVSDYYGLEEIDVSNLELIFNQLILESSPTLKRINLPSYNYASIKAIIEDNDNLTDLDWLPNTYIDYLSISENDYLSAIHFDNDSDDMGSIYICNNEALESIGSTNWMHDIGTLKITDNPLLSDITGLNNINSIRSLEIFDNTNLSACAIDPICEGLEAHARYYIGGNGSDCQSIEEVELLCFGPNSLAEDNLWNIVAYPNPANHFLHINSSGANIERVDLFDYSGKRLMTTTSDELDMSTYKKGLYILIVSSDLGTKNIKIVKL